MTRRWEIVAVRAAVVRSLRERGPTFVRLGFYAIVVSIVGALWRAAAARSGTVAGYTGRDLTWYITTSEAAICALDVRLIEWIGEDIASGAVVVEMLRPASVLWMRVATEFGRALPRLAACMLIGSVLAIITVGGPPRPVTMIFVVPAIVLAVACNLVAQHAFAAAAFWFRDARSTWFLYQKLVFVVGGMLLPLQFLPMVLQRIALALPFVTMAYVPARLASGHLEPQLILLQVVWLVVLSFAATAVFDAGERRLQAVGG